MANAVGPNGYDGGGGGGGGGSGRPPRLPRWTRQEILVLIQGKKVVEGRGGGRGGGRPAAEGGGLADSSWSRWWAAVAVLRTDGVSGGGQCRRAGGSNLAGIIRDKGVGEAKGRDRGESFWAMRIYLRRERRLRVLRPGVYEYLDGQRGEAEVEEAVFDSGRTAAEDGLFSDSEEEEAVAVAVTAAAARGGEEAEERSVLPPTTATAAAVPVVAMPISEKKYEAPHQESIEPAGTSKDKQPAHDTENEGHKRKRASTDEGETNVESQLIDVLERNSRMLSAQLEAQNLNSQLDREQRKDQTNSLLVILNKLADALGKIADKL
ncbi:trihelix transcription factor ASR3 [Ananas comosus]|uniref:Trihelix transcription factor ASR3 n=1 Tax=Ananas comosus TaxID=4615 RepID=A0A6P5GMU3_ANACO|nr:trihelix transcription factor ASR3 [Ananas comosus]